jgi:DNA repair protein Rad10
MSGFHVPDLESAEVEQEKIQRSPACPGSSNGHPSPNFGEAFRFARTLPVEMQEAANARHQPNGAAGSRSGASTDSSAQAAATSGSGASSIAPESHASQGNSHRPLVRRGAGANLLVSHRQRGNPLLASIRQVAWEHADIKPDYIMTPTSAAVFISVRYHLLHPQYVFKRMRELRSEFELRVLLIQVRKQQYAPAGVVASQEPHDEFAAGGCG